MIKKSDVYFIIPFHFRNYEELARNQFVALNDAGWKNKGLIQGEHDLYDYIASFIDKDEIDNFSVSWQYDDNELSKRRFYTKIAGKKYDWNIIRLGLVLFANGIGLLWFELNLFDSSAFSDSELQQVIYYLKELSRNEDSHFVEYKKYSIIHEEPSDKIIEFEKLHREKAKNITRWILSKNGVTTVEYEEKVNFYLEVLVPYIKFLDISTYFSNRIVRQNLIPDKAIPFVRIHRTVMEDETWDSYDVAFHLGRAYKSSYLMDSEIEKSEFYQPFKNIIWYASHEGCAIVSFTNNYETNTFLDNNNVSGYFYLFILSLSQYYSLLLLTQKVMETSMESASNNELVNLADEIKIFIIRNYFSQVGHLTQYNEMYSYVQNKLKIDILKAELEMKLQTLMSVVESRRQKNNKFFLYIFGVISGLFAVIQTFDVLFQWYNSGNIDRVLLTFIISVIVVLLSIFFYHFSDRKKYKTGILNLKKNRKPSNNYLSKKK